MGWQSSGDSWSGIDRRTVARPQPAPAPTPTPAPAPAPVQQQAPAAPAAPPAAPRATPVVAPQVVRRKSSRHPWLLTALAFVCGALVSAAVFTIGWRSLSQHNAAVQSALVTETKRNHRLQNRLAGARAEIRHEKKVVAHAGASLRAAHASALKVKSAANKSENSSAYVQSGANTMAAGASRIATELKTLVSYLTTTPTQDLDSGYIRSQSSYLLRQVDALESQSGSTSTATATFDAAIKKLTHLAAMLAHRK